MTKLKVNCNEFRYCLEENICCPICGSGYLHQKSLESWFRNEGDQNANHVLTSINGTFVDNSNERNPSNYRDGILIRFWCEECSAEPILAIIQHKGSTYIDLHLQPNAN